MFVVVHGERAHFGSEGQPDLCAFEGGAVVVAKDREQDLTTQLLVACGSPVDVEERRVGRGAAVLQHVVPQGVVAADAHVVGHDIEELAHAVVSERLYQPPVILFASEFGVQRGWVDDVVAVRATGPGFQVRRGVEIADSKLGQVWHEIRRLREGEVTVKLQPVCGAGYPHPARYHTTDQPGSSRPSSVTPSLA